MDFQELWKMVNELAKKHFYGTLEIEFKNGKPYLGVKKEKVLFDRPMVNSLSDSLKLADSRK